jgi:hypothetical protein
MSPSFGVALDKDETKVRATRERTGKILELVN